MSEVGSPFDWLNAIMQTGENLFEYGRTDYPAPLINKALSLHSDTLWPAFVMNTLYGLPPEMQNRYLLNIVEKKRRYSGKWPQPVEDARVENLQIAFNYSRAKAVEYAARLSAEQAEQLAEYVKKHCKPRPGKS